MFIPKTILECDIPELPNNFSLEMRNFVRECLHRDPLRRQSAEELLEDSWFKLHGAESYEICVNNVAEWILRSSNTNNRK